MREWVSECEKGIGVSPLAYVIPYPSVQPLHIHLKTFFNKTLYILFIFLFSTLPVCYAEDTSGPENTVPGSLQHTHSYGDEAFGLGADIIVLRPTESTSLSAQTRYDGNNETWSLFGVISVDLTDYYGK